MKATSKILIALGALSLSTSAYAVSITRVSEANFVAGAGLITFSEFPVDTTNPVYAPITYGGGAGSPTVRFGGYFTGQSLSANAGVDCPGAAATACVIGNPTGPLSLSLTSPSTYITTDGAFPSSPTLTGSPRFNGPIAALFDIDVAGVGFDGGYFNATGSTGITAFARDGTLLGTVSNTGEGIEFLGLVTNDGTNAIAGVFLDLVGAEPAGFNIDNLRFGTAGQVVVPGSVPEPSIWAMLMIGFGGIGAMMRSRRQQQKVAVSYS